MSEKRIAVAAALAGAAIVGGLLLTAVLDDPADDCHLVNDAIVCPIER